MLAGVWAAGAFLSGRLHLGRIAGEGEVFIRPILAPIMLGLLMVGVFVLGALVVREIDPLADYVSSVLEYADQGSLTLLAAITFVNGIAEELFFRGAMYAAIPRHPVLWTTSPTSSPRSRPATSCSPSPRSCSARSAVSSGGPAAASSRRS